MCGSARRMAAESRERMARVGAHRVANMRRYKSDGASARDVNSWRECVIKKWHLLAFYINNMSSGDEVPTTMWLWCCKNTMRCYVLSDGVSWELSLRGEMTLLKENRPIFYESVMLIIVRRNIALWVRRQKCAAIICGCAESGMSSRVSIKRHHWPKITSLKRILNKNLDVSKCLNAL